MNRGSNNIENYNIDLEQLESQLEEKLQRELSEIEVLKENRHKIGTPEALGDTVAIVVWEQFINQIGVGAGEDFIKENRGLTLDLRDEAHIQTTENFVEGQIATHNNDIDYKKRHDVWSNSFKKDENGNVKTRIDNRTGKEKAVLNNGARSDFDKGRPKGNGATDIDHTIPVSEIIRDPVAAAHLSREEQVDFANSDKNLNPLDKSANQSKGDSTTSEWLDSERDGKKPEERFDIDAKKLRKKDEEARDEYEKRKKEGEQKSSETGKKSQKEECLRIGSSVLKSIIMGLLADLLKNIIKKIIIWLKNGKKRLSILMEYIKVSVKEFIFNIKSKIHMALDISITTIITSIVGPISRTINKVWSLLKTGVSSIRDAIKYIKNPENRNKPIGLLILETAKIFIGGLTAIGAITVGEIIEKVLIAMPIFAIEIPLLGSLGSIVGMFFGALTSGIVGALIIRVLNSFTEKHQKEQANNQVSKKASDVISSQYELLAVKEEINQYRKKQVFNNISQRHKNLEVEMKKTLGNITKEEKKDLDFDEINKLLDSLE